ncbi:hypothetical protein ACE01N_17635 [Saccharicrinis sp. FJH2]|uniref:hypothetical protein n=1 Tax=Saccharicrinis sp. FJH65 TaxID=3344659 RepID=UPI0035F3E59F
MSLEIKQITKNSAKDCLLLKNRRVSVIIDPNCGGRIIEYSVKGENVLYVDPNEERYAFSVDKPPLNSHSPTGGRFDIGPELIIPQHSDLWIGEWDVIHADQLGIIIRSKKDRNTGIQLERFFKLSDNTSNLLFTQTIRNLSEDPVSCYHWSRTQVRGGGIFISPVSKFWRFPKRYVVFNSDHTINYMPEPEENVSVTDEEVIVKGKPNGQHIAFDSNEGWMAYVAPNDLMLVKQFHVYEERDYGEIVSNNMSLLYENDFCELSPFGPITYLEPGQEDSFTEEWWLYAMNFRKLSKSLDISEVREIIKAL